MAAETATVSAARGPGRADLVRFGAVELLIWSVVYGLYLAVRGVSIAGPDEAFANARGVVDVERALGLYHEASFQSALRGLDEALSVYYLLGFAPLIVGVLVWLGISHRPLYRELRTLLLVSIGVAVVVHVTLPVAPPRLLPGLGIADTVGLDHDDDSLFGIPFNPYAAMPSMHVGWSLLVGLVALKAARSPVLRGFFALHPAVMAISVTATGNHYFLDSLAGALVALLAVGVVRVVSVTRSRVCRAVSSRRATGSSTPPLIARVSCRGSTTGERMAA
jgi:membrane-associated phospholipid phosphatase